MKDLVIQILTEESKKLIFESGIRNIKELSKRYPKAKIYASSDAHFCIRKCADILCIEYVEIPTRNGSMNIDKLLDNATATFFS